MRPPRSSGRVYGAFGEPDMAKVLEISHIETRVTMRDCHVRTVKALMPVFVRWVERDGCPVGKMRIVVRLGFSPLLVFDAT
jgi:hypothetical protein